MKTLRILGIRGVPAAHGGFETFAARLAPYLVRKGWDVTVYCQEEGSGAIWTDYWNGVKRIHVPTAGTGPLSTILFDLKCIIHAARTKALCLTLGYNTAVFCALLRALRVPNLINMDGIEWARAKWGPFAKTWLWLNERAACWFGNHLIADHPEIKRHLSSRTSGQRITTIAYGAEQIENADPSILTNWGLLPNQFMTVVARAEPENSILEIVQGFSQRRRDFKLVVLGNYSNDNPYHRIVKSSANENVIFVGAIYDERILKSLRYHSLAYVHGHQVGGTNPSLVEALGAGNAVIAHDNKFNRWVAGKFARYFSNAQNFSEILDDITASPSALAEMRAASSVRFHEEFTWDCILQKYESLLSSFSKE